MIAQFTVDFEDFMALQKDGIKTSKAHKKRKCLIGFLGFSLLFIYSILHNTGILVSLFYSLLFFLFSPYVLYFPITLFKTTEFFKKDKRKYDFLLGKCTVTIDEKGIFKEYDNGYNTKEYVKWSQIMRATSDDKRFFLYKDDLNSLMIKKYPNNMNLNDALEYNKLIEKNLEKRNNN